MKESLTLSQVIRHPSSAVWPVLHLPARQDDVSSVKKINTAQKTLRLHLLEDDVNRYHAKIMASTAGAASRGGGVFFFLSHRPDPADDSPALKQKIIAFVWTRKR